ncbi:hypothetical protein AVEN_215742-1 [Araneus ventricosus]|uniref:Uncharacterized protein n=1 Tax=Araneus ventricosus TaxID=182803 RepID=A0A4Y2FJ55_ARAVE|nr:hypothetical protein AVEN_215742-1 [Araneus ventricosus]
MILITRYAKWTLAMTVKADLTFQWENKRDRENVLVKSHSDRSSVIIDYLVQASGTQIHANRRFTFSKLLSDIPQVSRSVLFKMCLGTFNVRNCGAVDGFLNF